MGSDDFYMTDIKAKGNKVFWKFSSDVNGYRITDASFFWEAKRMAWECSVAGTRGQARKRNMVYKNLKRELNDLWWDVYEQTSLKINGIHLGILYQELKKEEV